MIKKIFFYAVILTMYFGLPCFAEDTPQMSPEQFYLNQESAAKFASLRRSAKSSFRGILLYPDDVRNSILEVSQYPDLVVLLKNKKYLNEAEFEKFLKEKPAGVQDAVTKLKAYPEVIDILNENLTITALLGEMVKDKKDTLVQVIKRLSDSTQQEHAKAVDAWTKQLQQNPQAVKDMQAAAEAYAKQNKLPPPNQPMTAAQAAAKPNPYGYYVNDQNKVVVQDMPSHDMMQYALMNKAMYMMLLSVAMSNHSSYPDDYYWRYDNEEWEDHWNEYQDSLNNISNGLDDLNNNIDEIQDNREKAREEAKEKWQDKKDDREDRKEQISDKIQERRDSGDAKQIGERIQQAKASGLPEQFSNVNFQPPSRDQQINRASQFHAGSWGQRLSSGNLGARGGAARDFGGSARTVGGERRR